jgi:hypothetical protein
MSPLKRMVSDERSTLLQHYLTSLAFYLEASTEGNDPQMIEELRSEVQKAFASLEEL